MEGYEVIASSSAISGLKLAVELQPDLIVCDVNMPGKTGFDVAEILKTDLATADIPILLLTGETRNIDVRRGMSVGADDYLLKPVAVPDLLNAISTQCAKREARQKRESQRLQTWANEMGRVIGHELRTPVAVISPSIELLDDAVAMSNPGDYQTVSGFLKAGTHRLESTVRRIEIFLSLSSANLAETTPPQSTSTGPLQEALAQDCREVSERWKRTADLQLQSKNIQLAMNSGDFRQLTLELVDNAFKFSRLGSTVTVKLFPRSNFGHLEVTDYGCGMTTDQISKLTAFQQFDRNRREQQGLGLGLAIVSLLIRQVGGHLDLTPRPEGGLTVDACIPLLDASGSDAPACL